MEGSAGLVRCSLRAWRRCLGAVVMVGGVGWAIERSGHIYTYISHGDDRWKSELRGVRIWGRAEVGACQDAILILVAISWRVGSEIGPIPVRVPFSLWHTPVRMRIVTWNSVVSDCLRRAPRLSWVVSLARWCIANSSNELIAISPGIDHCL